MRVRDYAVIPLTSPYRRQDTGADHPANGTRNAVWLRLETDDGLVGWGESYLGAYATDVTVAALERCRAVTLAVDPSDPGAAMEEIRFRIRYWAARGIGAATTSAIEAALWDICGQARGQPVWQLLSDEPAQPVLAYASAGDDALDPAAIHAQAARFAAEGMRGYKMRAGGRANDQRSDQLARDVDRVAAARDALGPDRLLMVDVSVPQRRQAWSLETSVSYLRALEPFRLRFIEEPAGTWDVAAYQQLRRLGVVPVAGGESFTTPGEFAPFFDAGAFDVVQPDAAVIGGPASCVEVGRTARTFGVDVAVHAWSAGVGLAQNLHAALAIGGVMAIEWPQAEHPIAIDPIKDSIRLQDGLLLPPSAPGLGVRIDDDLLARSAYVALRERDY